MLRKHLRELEFNKGLLISEIGALITAAIIAQLTSLFTTRDTIIAIASSIGDYVGYTLTYAVWFFIDNKQLYWNGRTINKKFFKHMIRFIVAASGADIIYYFIRIYLNYYVLTIGFQPYIASILSQVLLIMVYVALMNIMAYFFGLIRDYQ